MRTLLGSNGGLALATKIDSRGERPDLYVYKCTQCARPAVLVCQGGELRKWQDAAA